MDELTPQEFAALARLTPEEAVAYLERRTGIRVTFDWRDMWAEEHAAQFTVSRLTRVDLLTTIRDALLESVEGDLSRRDFMRDIKAVLAKAGWWGEREVLDPETGKLVRTVFDPARLKLIYDTNTNNAYQAGLWERIQRNKRTSPYLRYITKRDERVRITHQALDNVALPVDDPWWDKYYPPNGWRCRCRVMTMSRKEYDDWVAKKRIKAPPKSQTKRWVNRRTGEVMDIPVGIDPGFDHHVGKASRADTLRQLADEKIDDLPPEWRDLARRSMGA
jgi:SPP1 gp7 family putative phage head morphogenesis protein